MKPALLTNKKLGLLAFSLAVAIAFPTNAFAAAGGLQVCTPNSTCEVGEFLYDDDYTPITDASCTITIKTPSGSAYETNLAMTANSDGWYSHEFTAPTTEGMYRSQVCCTSGTDYLCIDKSFEVKTTSSSSASTSEIAEAVWGYSDRTLTSFGTLVRDIWLNSTRTLTSLNIDNSSSSNTSTNNSTTTNSTTNLTIATNADLSDIEATVNENRLLLEELVNKPIIETYLEDDSQDLGEKLDETRTVANKMFANTQYLRSKATMIASSWNSFSDDELVSNLEDLVYVVGKNGDQKTNSTMLGDVNWLSKAWGWESVTGIKTETEDVAGTLDSVLIDITTRGRSAYAYNDIKGLVSNLDAIEALVGDSTIDHPDETLFGKLREVTRIAQTLDSENSKLRDLLVNWDSESESDIRANLNSISQKVSPLNRVSQLRGYLSPVTSDITGRELKNKAFAVGGVIDTNKQVLARSSDHALSNTWLELGSIVFKSVIINPSSLISQKARLEYYLPPELKEEDVLKYSEGLAVTYDTNKDQYFVEGEFDLEPNETITVSVSTEDIWVLSEEEIASVKRQVEELIKPLEGTAFFAQGITLKSDIEVALDRALALSARAITPEQKIRAYREAQIELNNAFGLIQKMQDLVTEVSAQSSLFAFVGGAQTLSVWGIIIVIIAAVVFLVVYLKVLQKENKAKTKKTKKPEKRDHHENPPIVFGQFNWPTYAKSAFGLLVFGAAISAATAFIVLKTVDGENQNLAENIPNTETPQVLSEVDEVEDPAQFEAEESALGGENIILVEVPQGSSLNVREKASLNADVVYSLKFTTEATKISEEGDFIGIVLKLGENGEDKIEGFVHSDFVAENSFTSEKEESIVDNYGQTETENASADVSRKQILIGETSTGWLRVRTAPRGSEISKVSTGLTFPYVDETTTWYKIQLDENTTGWISKEYASIVE